MLKKIQRDQVKKGFTLIELLIVIVIIGILAVLVLSTINPIEQRNKAKDTALQSTASELLNGIERYYASYGEYPWGTTPPGEKIDTTSAWFQELISSSEVKPEFANRSDFANLIMIVDSGDGGTNLVKFCFVPSSTQFKTNSMRYDKDGELNTTDPTHACIPE